MSNGTKKLVMSAVKCRLKPPTLVNSRLICHMITSATRHRPKAAAICLLLSTTARALSVTVAGIRGRTLPLRPLQHQLWKASRQAEAIVPDRGMSSNFNNETSLDTIRSQKQALRREIRGMLKLLTRDDIELQSAAVWERLHALPTYQNARSVGLFLSMPSGEIDTDPAIAHAVQERKEIYVPLVGANFELPDMQLIKVDYEARSTEDTLFHYTWPKNKWDIPEPPSSMTLQAAQPGDIDVLIVPGLAFDRAGNRLGQGKGYYDRFLSRMFADPTKKKPVLVAVGMDCQLLHEPARIPVHEHDFAVEWILVPNETIEIR
jgi:5-formyltetrahydrofolate cyclo-ligase